MSTQDVPRRLDRATAERLLRGDSPAGQARLAALLATLPVSHRAGEPRGEEAAMEAYRAARPDPANRPRRTSMLKTTLAKLLTVKVGALCAASLGVGGVALAAGTGNLPAPVHLGAAPSSSTASHRPHPSGTPSVRPSHSALPPGLWQQCHDYLGRDADHRGRALDDPAFHDLILKAGAKDRGRVDGYCGNLLHDWPSGGPSALPSGHNDWPGGAPGATGPSGRPSARPTQSGPTAPRPSTPPSRPPTR
jgi:hypothetical protein